MDRYEEELPPSEQARDRRRDREAGAKARAGMRTGLAKQFKQVLDTQRKRAEEAVLRTPAEPPDDGRAPRRWHPDADREEREEREVLEDREETDGGPRRNHHR